MRLNVDPGVDAVVDAEKAVQVAHAKNSAGEDYESYDFYLLMKSELTRGWTVRSSSKEW